MADTGKTEFLHENASKFDEVVTKQQDWDHVDNPPPTYCPQTVVVGQPLPCSAVELSVSNGDEIRASIFVTVCCCLPLGLLALVFASEYK